ncbi:MAG: DUF86 domain-containing protein [Candidatus Methylomirabilis sp.]|nr:DUF86 domain-containing protein [Deltaproteobacteria bacterium]
MQPPDRLYIGRMYDLSRKVAERARSWTREEVDRDEDRQMAMTMLLQQIGEAARRVSLGLRQAHPEIPWNDIMGMRHRIVHDYFRIDLDIVWDAAVSDIGPLVEALRPILDELGGEPED